jgi:two-component system, OmpR family, sensor histidine kinase BaeS
MSLFSRLFLVNSLSILATLGAVFFIVRKKAASYFMALADKYGIEPGELHEMFLQALNYGFLIAGLFSVTIACLAIWWLVKRFVNPVTKLSQQFEEISAGSFDVRADTHSTPELSQLAESFNRMAEELEKQERLRQRLIVDIAHELKTPITNLRGTLEGVEDGLIVNDVNTTRELIHEVDRLTKLVNEILDLARLEARKDPVIITKSDLKEITRSSFNEFGSKLARKNLQCSLKRWPDSAPIECDTNKIQRVFANLLSNIERYAPDGDRIDCEFHACKGGYRIKLVNAAPALKRDDINNLFERFYRADLSRNSQGSGLGLSIVKQLVELHGGRVGADYHDNRLSIWFQLPRENFNFLTT